VVAGTIVEEEVIGPQQLLAANGAVRERNGGHRIRRPSERANAACSCIASALFLMMSALARHWRVTLRIVTITARCPAHRSIISA
jgi:hypothetical protein